MDTYFEKLINQVNTKNYLDGLDLINLMKYLLIPNRIVLDIGSYKGSEAWLMEGFIKKIRRYPLLWKWFFMINCDSNDYHNELKKLLNKAKSDGELSELDFSLMLQYLMISNKDYLILDSGNYRNINAVVAYELIRNIKRHPLIWKWFFMLKD